MGSVLWFLTRSKGQMSRFTQPSPKAICMIQIQNVMKVHPCKAGYWRWLLCNLGLRRNSHWFMTSSQNKDPIKGGTNSHPFQPLGHRQPRQKKDQGDTRWRFCSWLFSLVWFVLPKKRKLSKVSQRYQGRSDLGGARVCVCVCVCVHFLVLLCWSIGKLCPFNSTLLQSAALDLSCLVSVSSLLCIDSHAFFLL